MMTEKEFLTKMIMHHEDAIKMSNELLQAKNISSNTMLLAIKIIMAQTSEIKLMQDLLNQIQ